MELFVRDLVGVTGGRRVHGPDRPITAVSIDTRTLPQGAAFFCLRGPRFDGHDFAEAAVGQGAQVLVCDENGLTRIPRAVRQGTATVVCVPETEQALVALAAEVRRRFNGTVIGVTGSAGKTTTKEMLGAVLSTLGPTLKTQGNLNNQLGVPLTLMRLEDTTRFAVIEMGTNAPGEIEFLAGLARPHHGIVTSVGAAHLEGLGGVLGVAWEKGALLRVLPREGLAFVPTDIACPWVLTRNVRARLETVGHGPGEGVRRLSYRETARGVVGRLSIDGISHRLALRMPGAHNLDNAMLAIACGRSLGVSPEIAIQALETLAPANMRGEIRRLPHGVRALVDCYNANPASMQAAVRAFHRIAPRGLMVLGDMLELGVESAAAHRDMGRFVASLPGARLLGVGPRAAAMVDAARSAGLSEEQATHASDAVEAGTLMRALLAAGDWVLLKASRGIGLERALTALTGEASLGHGLSTLGKGEG